MLPVVMLSFGSSEEKRACCRHDNFVNVGHVKAEALDVKRLNIKKQDSKVARHGWYKSPCSRFMVVYCRHAEWKGTVVVVSYRLLVAGGTWRIVFCGKRMAVMNGS